MEFSKLKQLGIPMYVPNTGHELLNNDISLKTEFIYISLLQVAVCGLPEPRDNHAVAMARFAAKCLKRMKALTRELELSLGPVRRKGSWIPKAFLLSIHIPHHCFILGLCQGTADLALRVGLNSGPTIAGVLRGERARFQLFGDTVCEQCTRHTLWILKDQPVTPLPFSTFVFLLNTHPVGQHSQ